MKLKALSPMLDGWEGTATLGTDLDAAPDGSQVLILDGQGPVKPEEAVMFELEIVAAEDGEREALVAAGFQLGG
jgi:hypothetical protein